MPCRKEGKSQVRPAGQAGYPISLVASLDTVPVKCCVPLQAKTIQKNPCDYKGYTHTRLPEGRRKAKVRANVRVCAHKRQENDDMTGGPDGTEVCVVEMKGEPSAHGQGPMCTQTKKRMR